MTYGAQLAVVGFVLGLGFGAIFAHPALANSDGSCIYQKKPSGSTVREDVHIGNGETYHQPALIGKKSGIVFRPEMTFLCKNGQLTTVKQ